MSRPMVPITDGECLDYQRGWFNHDCTEDPMCCDRAGLTAVASERDRRVAAKALRVAADALERGGLYLDGQYVVRGLRRRADEMDPPVDGPTVHLADQVPPPTGMFPVDPEVPQ